MNMSIEQKISLLPPEKQKEYREELMDVLYDESWLENYGIDYIDPDIQKVKEILFKERYE